MSWKYKKAIISFFLISLMLLAPLSVMNGTTMTGHNAATAGVFASHTGKLAIAEQTISKPYNQLSVPSQVNVYSLYSKEPAPMGIVDYGIGPNGKPYEYNTTSFLGSIQIDSLITYNSSLNASSHPFGPYGMSFQLNINLVFSYNSKLYDFWAQNVVFLNTSNREITFEDNVWNYSSPGANMYNTTIIGNGSVFNSSAGHFYAVFASQYLLGNYINLNYPARIQLMINSTLKNGQPELIFEYNDGYGWIVYDNPIFPFVNNLLTAPEFLVDGYSYNPSGYTFYDAELILGGPAGGSQTSDQSSNVQLQLEYWNGHNFQQIVNAYNFGSDTAEGIQNVISSAMYYPSNGTIFAQINNGSGSLGQLYNQSEISIVNISTGLPSGFLSVNGTRYYFVNGDVNVTLAPGKYELQIYNSNDTLIAEGNFTLTPGEYLPLAVQSPSTYDVTFTERNLPLGTKWFVNLSNGQSFYSTSNNISFAEPNGTYSYTIATSDKEYAPSPSSGTFIVKGSSVSITVSFTLVVFSVTFTETGLPSSTTWYVNLSSGQSFSSTSNTITFTEPNGSYFYTVSTVNKEYAPVQYSGTFIVNGKNVTAGITFKLVTYTVSFTENGLPSGTNWTVTFNGVAKSSNTNVITFIYPNGSYSFTIGFINGYKISPSSGTISINGANVSEKITFTQITYTVTFSESGLPAGTLWYVNLSNGQSFSSTSSIITFSEPNGTYYYTIATSNKKFSPVGYSGSFLIDGSAVSESITFNLVTYRVTFTESGLSPGASWSVTLNGTAESSTSSQIIFNETNGTYSFTISSISGYRASRYSGTITVAGSSINFDVNWSIITYPITITENGIPNGTSWSVTLTGTTFTGQTINITLSSTTNTITFNEPNGTYTYTVHLPSGYQTSNGKGSLSVSGVSLTTTVSAIQKTPTTSRSPNTSIYAIIGIVVIIAIIGAVLALVRKGRKK